MRVYIYVGRHHKLYRRSEGVRVPKALEEKGYTEEYTSFNKRRNNDLGLKSVTLTE